MKTSSLDRQYDKLTPWERLPLIVAAEGRGDSVELDRLFRSAPQKTFWIADVFGLRRGLERVASILMLKLIDLAHKIEKIEDCLEWHMVSRRTITKEYEKRCKESLGTLGYRFLVHVDGWRLFCDQLSIDHDILLRGLPGYDSIRQAEEMARLLAFTEDEYLDFQGTADPSKQFVVTTAETEAAAMHDFLEAGLAQWS